jgi:hypothetical protein
MIYLGFGWPFSRNDTWIHTLIILNAIVLIEPHLFNVDWRRVCQEVF